MRYFVFKMEAHYPKFAALPSRDRIVYDGSSDATHIGQVVAAMSSLSPQPSNLDYGQRSEALPRTVFDSPRTGDRKIGRLVLHLAISAGLTLAILETCLWLPHIDHATVALLLVAASVGLATVWGRTEALTSAIIGGLGFDYYYLASTRIRHRKARTSGRLGSIAVNRRGNRSTRRAVKAAPGAKERLVASPFLWILFVYQRSKWTIPKCQPGDGGDPWLVCKGPVLQAIP